MSVNQHLRHPSGDRETPEQNPHGQTAQAAATQAAPTANEPTDAANGKLPEGQTLKLLLRQFAELREHMLLYATARMDGAKASARNAIGRVVLAAMGFIVVCGIAIMASWLALSGIAQGVAELFGGRPWIGTLLTGLAVLCGIAVAIRWAVAARVERARRRTVAKYDARQAQQRSRCGRNAHVPAPATIADRK